MPVKLEDFSQPGPSDARMVAAMTEALTSGDPELRYLVDSPVFCFDKFCVSLYLRKLINGLFACRPELT